MRCDTSPVHSSICSFCFPRSGRVHVENVRTTQAEYLAVAAAKADEGFDSLSEAAAHATDMLMVRDAYAGGAEAAPKV